MSESQTTLKRAEMFFRTYLHAVMPLHDSLVRDLCAADAPPLELATALEDIGQRYMDMASRLNGELIRRGLFDAEPEPEDSAEARINAFAADLVARAGTVRFHDGTSVDGRLALDRSPVVQDAVRVALHLARGDAAQEAAADALPPGREHRLPPLPFTARY